MHKDSKLIIHSDIFTKNVGSCRRRVKVEDIEETNSDHVQLNVYVVSDFLHH